VFALPSDSSRHPSRIRRPPHANDSKAAGSGPNAGKTAPNGHSVQDGNKKADNAQWNIQPFAASNRNKIHTLPIEHLHYPSVSTGPWSKSPGDAYYVSDK
jgi:hypothetical protein